MSLALDPLPILIPPSDCFINSSTAGVSTLTASQLATVQLSGSARSGGLDSVELSAGSGQATSVTNSDNAVDLASSWNTTEWGVYGDGSGSEAYFGTGTTLQAQTALTATSTSAPSCIEEGFTGETNNLSLTSTPALGSQSAPTMATRQTDGTAGTASCAVASGANVVTVTAPGTQTTKKGTAVSLPIHATDSAPGQKLTYSATGLPAGLSINPATGLISGTPSTLQSASVKVTAKDTTGASGSVGFGWIIYLNK
jgi:Putative Ig domain